MAMRSGGSLARADVSISILHYDAEVKGKRLSGVVLTAVGSEQTVAFPSGSGDVVLLWGQERSPRVSSCVGGAIAVVGNRPA